MRSGETIEAAAAARRPWEAVVIGAGPAGSMVARELAAAGAEVLLVDRQSFPRAKVCGGCLNGRTLALLESAGLGDLVESLGAQPLDRFELWADGRVAAVGLPRGAAVSRTALDAALVEAAVERGARLLPGVRAVLGSVAAKHRIVRLPERELELRAGVVVAADGLGGSALAGSGETRARAAVGSRVGAGAEVGRGPEWYRPGAIYMAVGRGGYVGLARVEGGRLNLAAALDPASVREAGGLGAAAGRLLRQAGLPGVPSARGCWRGTPPLTRRAPAVALERVFLLGDAAGYVEPFTGEGISWALESALTAAPLAARAIGGWSPDLARLWRREHRRRIVGRQRWCRAVSWWLRRPALVGAASRLLSSAPRLASPLIAHLNADSARGGA